MATVFSTQTRGPQTLQALYNKAREIENDINDKVENNKKIKFRMTIDDTTHVKLQIDDIDAYISAKQTELILFAWTLPAVFKEEAVDFVNKFWSVIKAQQQNIKS